MSMEWISGNVMIRPMSFAAAGDVVEGHAHNFDHTSIVFCGAVRVRCVLRNGFVREQEFRAPAHFLVLAGVEHRIEALEPDTVVWCVYSHRTPQGDVVQDWDGWGPGYV